MAKFTIIGEYWDNEQGYAAQVEAKDEDAAIELAQTECGNELREEDPDYEGSESDELNQPLKIWAVLAGWPKVLYTHDV